MKKEKILAIILIMNFMLFYVSNIVFAINIDNSLVETKTEEIDSNIEDELDNEIKEPDIIDDESEEIEEETKTETEPNENQESEEAKTEPNENQESEEAETESNENEDSEEIKEDKKQEEILTIQQNIGKSIQTIKNGTYVMSSALSSRMVLDVSGGSTANCANVQIWEDSYVKQQRFNITYLEDGYYKIESAKSKKVLDVMNAGKTNGTNVHQYQSNNTDAQKWIIKSAGNGYYYIISKCNGLYLDITGAYTSNGTNVQMYTGNSTNAQKFAFEEVEDISPKKTIKDGIYEIETALNSKMVLDVNGGYTSNGTNIQIYKRNDTNAQKFNVSYLNNGYYKIESINSRKVLDVANAGKTNYTNVQQYTSNNSDAQKWIIKDEGNGYYTIISKCNGLHLDVSGGSTANSTNIQMYKNNKSNAQKFRFVEIKGTQVIKDGTYEISTALNSKVVLDVSQGSTANCANVQVWESANVSQQKFKITYLNNGYYKIECAKSKKVLDVMNAGKTNGTNVHQYQSNNTEAQDWIIKNAGNGYFYIVSRCNGLYLDVSGGSAANGTNVQLYLGNNTKAQKFKFKEGYMGIDVSSYQASINWASVKEYGIDFTMLRIGGRYYGSGGIYEDICFAKNAIGAKANNIDIGIYFYSQAITKQEAKEEANFVINTLRKYNVKVTYPVVIDTERTPGGTGRADGLSAKDRTDICIEFLETIKSAGYKPMLYANKEWLINDLEISRLSNYDVWLAHYTKQTDYKNSYTMWQYTSSGSIPGILGNVDMDICYTKYF